MKLVPLQWAWLLASLALFATVLIDVANVADVPESWWIIGLPLLAISGWWIMPSVKALAKANRRRP